MRAAALGAGAGRLHLYLARRFFAARQAAQRSAARRCRSCFAARRRLLLPAIRSLHRQSRSMPKLRRSGSPTSGLRTFAST